MCIYLVRHYPKVNVACRVQGNLMLVGEVLYINLLSLFEVTLDRWLNLR